MLSLLFNSSFWIGFGVVAVICIIIWICAKYPSAKVFVLSLFGSAFAVALIAVTVWCGINLGYYYTARGGIFGALSGIDQTNTVTITDAEFNFENIELTRVEGDRYSATVNSNGTFKLDNDAEYIILVNGYPCSDVEMFDTYITASYTYEFLSDELQPILTDTLNIAFVFDNNYTYATITTNGGANAVEYWNSYFSRNNFVVKLSFVENSDVASDIYNSVKDETNYIESPAFEDDKLYLFDLENNDIRYNRYKSQNGTTFIGVQSLNKMFIVQSDNSLEQIYDKYYCFFNELSNYDILMADGREKGILLYDASVGTIKQIYTESCEWAHIYEATNGNVFIYQQTPSSNVTTNGILLYEPSTQSVTRVYEEGWGWDIYHELSNQDIIIGGVYTDGVLIYINASKTIEKVYNDGDEWSYCFEISNGDVLLASGSPFNDKGILLFDYSEKSCELISTYTGAEYFFEMSNGNVLVCGYGTTRFQEYDVSNKTFTHIQTPVTSEPLSVFYEMDNGEILTCNDDILIRYVPETKRIYILLQSGGWEIFEEDESGVLLTDRNLIVDSVYYNKSTHECTTIAA